ncbi:unnamed protein product [Spirodela intermedia]|uniref:BHLH domain-containing protein n=1 Tax=Spirodela intermedia TaxID=51605 RepID=A0A7I8KCR1_SPIIN|nr:unnamed protein product [Spirodela intermedia]
MELGGRDAASQETNSSPSRNHPGKVPKKIHKSEREKQKRDQLNDLFYELGNALEPARQNNGKASILSDAARLLQDLHTRVESLRRENAALAAESRHKTAEKDELRDEKAALEAEIQRLQNELQERLQSSSSAFMAVTQPAATSSPEQQLAAAVAPSNLSRPQARYPTPADSWPMQILSQQERRTSPERGGGRPKENTEASSL